MAQLMKRVSILIVVVLMIMLAACSSKNDNSSSNTGTVNEDSTIVNNNVNQTGETNKEEELVPYNLTLALPIFGATPRDLKEVENEVNKITQDKINTTVTILPISIGAWAQQMNLMTAGGEKLDLFFIFGQGYSNTASNGSVLELDELLEKYGQGIIEQVGRENLKAAAINGKIYGVPSVGSYTEQPGISMRKDLVEKYNIDISSIKSIEDLTDIFQIIKDHEPNMVPLASGLSSPIEYYRWYDRLGDGIGVLPDFDNGFKVENLYETPRYLEMLNLMREWYKKGFINKDAATTQVDPIDLVNTGKAFSYMVKLECGTECGGSTREQYEMVIAALTPEPVSTTNNVLVGLYGIAQQSENPERAMMMLDLMYTSKELANLLTWGIEGKHYIKISDTQVDYPEGVDASNVGYSYQAWLVGNALLTYNNSTQVPDYWDRVKETNEKAIKSKALGFSFNAEPVYNEMTAINNVIEQYEKVLETGTVDPASKLEEFLNKLKTAGIDKYIAEKQRQLDEWVAANK